MSEDENMRKETLSEKKLQLWVYYKYEILLGKKKHEEVM